MKALVICPEHREAGQPFQRKRPLALTPILGRTRLDHALSELKAAGVQEVVVLASDRPEMIRDSVGKGEKWGLKIAVIPTPEELPPDVAEARYGQRQPGDPRVALVTLDSLPAVAGLPLWRSHTGFFEFMRQAVSTPEVAGRLTMREAWPKVWVSTRANISNMAEIEGPAWIGPDVTIGAGAKVGPNAVIESKVFLDDRSIVRDSWVGPSTYVGADTTICDSLAWGNGLLNWRNGSWLEVRDSFLLHDLSHRVRSEQRAGLFERLLALLIMVATLPLALIAIFRAMCAFEPVFEEKRVLLPPLACAESFAVTFSLLRLKGVTGMFRRWPELWRVFRGDMSLVGNRPLSPEELTSLRGPVAELWLRRPAGVFSLADAEGADGDHITKSMAHSAFFAVKADSSLQRRILRKCLTKFAQINHPSPPAAAENEPLEPAIP